MVSKHDSEYHEEESMTCVWTIPIACGIFTFIYWFIVTPILWKAINLRNDSHMFGIFIMSLAVLWSVIVGLLVCIWWLKRQYGKPSKEKAVKDHVHFEKKDSSDSVSENCDSPPFPTQPHVVQPSDTPVSYSFNELPTDLEKDVMNVSLNSCPVQLQVTPTLYNARTGQQSFELGLGDSSSSVSVPSVVRNYVDQESDILTVKKSTSTGSGVRRIISSTDSEGMTGDVLKEPSPGKNKSGDNRSITVETAVIEHNAQNVDAPDFLKEAVSDSQVPRLSSSDSFHGLPEMNSFDAYLHLTTVDTPMTPPTEVTSPTAAGLTPRQLFFVDLIKQAEENQAAPCIRRSEGDEVIPRQKVIADKHKSMPLYLHFVNNPVSSLSSSKHVLDVPTVAGCPVSSKDQVLITDSENKSPTSPTQKVTHDNLRRNLKNTESEYVDPENSTGTKTGRDVTGGEYFIANVARNRSVTSEVYLNIGNDTTVVEPGTSMQWELVVDDDLSDDCVFEDDNTICKKKN